MSSVGDLIDGAKGDSVTEAKLTGEERYYLEIEDTFVDEQPHYIVLLTTSGNSITVRDGDHKLELSTSEASLALTDRGLHAYTGGIQEKHLVIGYDSISSVLRTPGDIIVHAEGTRYTFNLAKKHVDDENVEESFRFLQDKIL